MIALQIYSAPSPRGALILAPGAGAGQKSPFMVRIATAIAAHGFTTATFDFPYMTEGRRVPDRTPVLEARWREAIADARGRFDSTPLFIGGKSMGGRIASHVAADTGVAPLAGLIFFGYPLHPPGKPEQRRDRHLPDIEAPMLFIQGTRDAFGAAEEIRALLPGLRRAALHEIAGGDHSLNVRRAARTRAQDPLDEAVGAAVAWMGAHVG